MKKLHLALLILLAIFTNAQVTFNPGFRAGANFAKFTQSDSGMYNWLDDDYYDYENGYYGYGSSYQKDETAFMTDFYLGFQGNIRFTKFYALQPEINYSRQGTKITVTDNNNVRRTFTPKISYLSFQIVNKFYFDKFNIHVAPSLDFALENKNFNPSNRVDLGFLLGLGYDITPNFGIEARIKKGLIEVAYSNSENRTNVLIQTGVYFTLPKSK